MLTNTIPFIMPWIIDYAAGAGGRWPVRRLGHAGRCDQRFSARWKQLFDAPRGRGFCHARAHGLSRVLSVMALLFILVIGSFGIVLLVTGDRIPVFVYGAEFRNTGPLVATLAVNVLAGSLGMIAAQGLLVIGRQRNNFVIDIGMFSITMITAVLLVPRYGALGAAIASLLGVTAGTSLRDSPDSCFARDAEAPADVLTICTTLLDTTRDFMNIRTVQPQQLTNHEVRSWSAMQARIHNSTIHFSGPNSPRQSLPCATTSR